MKGDEDDGAPMGQDEYLIVETLAGKPADAYIAAKIVAQIASLLELDCDSLSDIRTALQDPRYVFVMLLGKYASQRRSDDLDKYSEVSARAVSLTLGNADFAEFLDSGDYESLWLSFAEICGQEGVKPREPELRSIIEGFAELGMEVYAQQGEENLLNWLSTEIRETSRLKHVFERLGLIKGLGPKSAGLLLRDLVLLSQMEDSVHFAHRLYLQPITASVRKVSKYIIPEAREEKLADWVIAGKLGKAARCAGVSGIRLNMGAHEFASQNSSNLPAAIQRIVRGE